MHKVPYQKALPEKTIRETLASIVSMALCSLLMQTLREGGARGYIKTATWHGTLQKMLKLNVQIRQRQLGTGEPIIAANSADFDSWLSGLGEEITPY